jgi:hypothetical protein
MTFKEFIEDLMEELEANKTLAPRLSKNANT